MTFSRVTWFLVVLIVLSVDFSDGALLAKGYWWTSKYWYGLARFAGGMGLRAESAYHEEMERVRG